MENSEKEYCVCISGEKYAFDLGKMKEFCLVSDLENSKEQEIVENWEVDPEDGSLGVISKINREMRSPGNVQNDSILYDMMKVFVTTLLASDVEANGYFSELKFSEAISLNTLLTNGIIYKIQ